MVKQRCRKKYASCDIHEQWLSIQGMNAFLCYAGYRSLRSRLHHVAETPASVLCRIPLVTQPSASCGRDTCFFAVQDTARHRVVCVTWPRHLLFCVMQETTRHAAVYVTWLRHPLTRWRRNDGAFISERPLTATSISLLNHHRKY